MLGFGWTGLYAQTASIKGKVETKGDKSNEPAIGATVSILNGTKGTITDFNGEFELHCAPGKYELVVHYIGYEKQTFNVELLDKESYTINVELITENTNLAEVQIVERIEKSTNVAQLQARRNTAVISDGISADQFRKSPDRNVSDVMKRITGTSIQENKFVIIRGMNDRYNASYLDNQQLASTETDRKAFSFDLIPSGLIDNIQIIKSGSPELSSDFGGGIIKINTKSIPTEKSQSISIGLNSISNTSFKPFREFELKTQEKFLFLDKNRRLPNLDFESFNTKTSIPTEQEKYKLETNTTLLEHNWKNQVSDAAPNSRFQYSLAIPIQFKEDLSMGIVFAVNYSNTRRIVEGVTRNFDGSGQVSDFKDISFRNNYTGGALCNLSLQYQKHKFQFANFLSKSLDLNTVSRSGIANITDQVEVNNLSNYVNFNIFRTHSLSYELPLSGKLNFFSQLSYNSLVRENPDYKIASYAKTPETEGFVLVKGDFFNSSTGRFFSNLSENNYSILSGVELTLLSDALKIKSGISGQWRDRKFETRNFVYAGDCPSEVTLNPEKDLNFDQMGNHKLFMIEKTNKELSNYYGKTQNISPFVSSTYKWSNKIELNGGVRVETQNLSLTNPYLTKAIAKQNELFVLPTINLKYSPKEKQFVRVSYYQSINRPEYREIAPFAFYNFEKNAEIKGNPSLTTASLNHADVRYEFYPTNIELISVGAFYKQISNPIEMSLDVTQPFTTFTYQNQKSAQIYGIELEIRKSLGFIHSSKFFHNLSTYSNLTLSKSKVQFFEGSHSKQNRALQGQAPLVANIGLQYENENRTFSANVQLNYVSDRIGLVGIDPKYGETRTDIFEKGRTVIDFQVFKKFGKFGLRIGASDVLRQNQVYYQDADHNNKYNDTQDRVLFLYRLGWQGNASLSYQF